jgi:GntR family transcriptional repressor for pyruvate dehydrogenase complex
VVKPIPEPQFDVVQRSQVPTEAMEIIKRMILRGELVAGQKLPPERQLALQLGVSRPSLREAISALIALNILESRHGHGTFVTSLDPELLIEPIDFVLHVNEDNLKSLFEARRALEAGAAALAAQRAGDIELARMEEHVKRDPTMVGDPEAFLQHDVQFHDMIRRASHSPILSSLLGSIAALSIESRRRTGQQIAARQRSVSDHRAMVRALKARDARAAYQAMIDHLSHVEEVLWSSRQTTPQSQHPVPAAE